jgi:hypothetical protein
MKKTNYAVIVTVPVEGNAVQHFLFWCWTETIDAKIPMPALILDADAQLRWAVRMKLVKATVVRMKRVRMKWQG